MMRLFGISGGSTVTEDNALSLSTVFSCVRVISEGIASLPWHVYKNVDEGKETAKKHPIYNILHAEANRLTSSFNFRETLIAQVLLWGNGYAWIERNEVNRPVGLWLQKPWEVIPVMQDGNLFYQTPSGMIPSFDMIHVAGLGFDGIVGKSPIKLQAEQLGITMDAVKFGSSFFKNGATLGGILTNDSGTVYTEEQRKQLKKAWHEEAHGGANNHSTKILGGGLKYQRVGVPPEEAQFLQTRQMGAVEICGMFRVPPHMVAITDKSTSWGSGIEQQDIGFVKYTLLPWIVRITQEFDRKLFRESEKGTYFTGFNINGFLKGDIAAQTAHIEKMLMYGVYDINKALSFLDQNTIGEAGNRRFVQKNMIPLDRADDIIDKETNKQDNGEGTQIL